MPSLLSESMFPGEIRKPLGLTEDLKGVSLLNGRKVDSAYISHIRLQCGLDDLRREGYELISFRDFLGLLIACSRQLEQQSTLLREGVVWSKGSQSGPAATILRESPLVMAIEQGRGNNLYDASEFIDPAKQAGELYLAEPNQIWVPTKNHPELAHFFANSTLPGFEKFAETLKFTEALARNGIQEISLTLEENTPRIEPTCPIGQLATAAYTNKNGRAVTVTSYSMPPKDSGSFGKYADIINSKFRMRGIRKARDE